MNPLFTAKLLSSSIMNLSILQRSTPLALCLGLCATLPLQAQQRAAGGGNFGGGGFGNFGGNRATTSSSSSSTRSYPSSGTIGDAYYSIDPESRRVLVIADAETSRSVFEVLSNLDRPKPQVLIKVVFLEVTYNNASDIGIEGSFGKNIGDGNQANVANGLGLAPLNSVVTNAFGQQTSSGFGPTAPVTAPGAGLYQLSGQNFQVTMRAIAQSGKAKVLSRPSILARNNQPATIEVGQYYPYVSGISYYSSGSSTIPISSVAYRDIGVILQVTPFITDDGQVEMIIAPSISAVDPTTSVTISQGVNANAINVRSANTVAVTPDGQTVMIGGLIQDSKSKTDTKIPLLGDIPVVGNLFKRQQNSDAKTELIMFLTPHIVMSPSQLAALSNSEQSKRDPSKNFTEQELNKYLDDLPKKADPAGDPKKDGKSKAKW